MHTRAQKKRKIEQEKLKHSFMGVFWDPTLFPQLGKFLSVNDSTNLSITCKEIKQVVESSFDDDAPRLVWEFRGETQISFDTFDDDDDDAVFCNTSQVQNFTFHLVDKRLEHKQVQVGLSLENILWIEEENKFYSMPYPGKGPTRMRVYVRHPATSTQTRDRIFVSHPDWFCFVGTGRNNPEDDYHNYIRHDNNIVWNEEDKKTLRFAMECIFTCVQSISNWSHDDSDYPSTEYLMRDLPQWLHPFFPQNFDWQAEHQDRVTEPEFHYCPAPNRIAWMETITEPYHRNNTYYLDELPWYESQALGEDSDSEEDADD